MMPVPPTLTAASERRGSLLTVPRHSGMILGRGWPGDEQTPRAVAPPAGTGDAVVAAMSGPIPETSTNAGAASAVSRTSSLSMPSISEVSWP